ncbi:hypothetical protein SKAU_G00221730 [Synaphobranchus kaupii]|uniref:Uncharacterized protein n=1 Tax=Synaphobranchus kaupii TaxID=118154 RepID=A0A9Q1FBD9_SYNKA|nr:hypothetical protein SKAU_G00221730 [Synaphobranchus kaupii]
MNANRPHHFRHQPGDVHEKPKTCSPPTIQRSAASDATGALGFHGVPRVLRRHPGVTLCNSFPRTARAVRGATASLKRQGCSGQTPQSTAAACAVGVG